MVASVYWWGFRTFGSTPGNIEVHFGASTPNYPNLFLIKNGVPQPPGGPYLEHFWLENLVGPKTLQRAMRAHGAVPP